MAYGSSWTEAAWTRPAGLTSSRAEQLLCECGPNEIARRRVSHLRILSRQLTGSIFWLLATATVLSFFLGEEIEASTMAFILVLNVLVGFAEEAHSENSLHELRAAVAPRARVRRDGRVVRVLASRVVPGDVLVLEPGDVIAADAVVRESRGLLVDEAELTGQAHPVAKLAAKDESGTEESRLLMGTAVVGGGGTAEVVATGARANLARVTGLAEEKDESTPLRVQLDGVGRALIGFCVAIVTIVAAIDLARGAGVGQVVIASLSLAVASLPESLGATVTVALTAVARRLSSMHVLVRRLDAVETLGGTTLVCVGKSGTLTTSELVVKETVGTSRLDLLAVALGTVRAKAASDPVQRAIARAALDAGLGMFPASDTTAGPDALQDADGTCVGVERQGVLYARGPAEAILSRCEPAGRAGSAPIDLKKEAARMKDEGLLVLAVARRAARDTALECIGLLGLAERPRPETRDAVAQARRAGIRVVMMTGDHARQARAVAEEVGLADGADVRDVVFADVTPEQKVERVRHWKAGGDIVAVTGERMNDAAAVAEAHVGIALGNPGSDVTRDAADVVLTDDDFSHLIAGIREGRAVFLNIRRSLVYVLAGNLAELSIMLIASVLGWPEPLLPVQLLWINLVTDSLPAFALVLQPPDANILDRAPRSPDEPMLGQPEWTRIVVVGLLQTALALALFRMAAFADLSRAQALATSTVVFGEVFWALALAGRTGDGRRRRSILRTVVGVTVLAECALALLPIQNRLALFHLAPPDLVLSLLAGFLPLGFVRLRAALSRRASKDRSSGGRTVTGSAQPGTSSTAHRS